MAEVGFSPPRSVNRPFCYLGILKGRFSSIWVSYFALSRCATCDCCNFHLGMNELINYLCVVCYIVSFCVNSLPNAPCPTSPIAKCIVIFSDKRMPGCAYLTKYLDFRDENKVRVGNLAEQIEKFQKL